MSRNSRIGLFAGALMRVMTPALRLSSAPGLDRDDDRDSIQDRHILLLSIDGMHAVDFQNCVVTPT